MITRSVALATALASLPLFQAPASAQVAGCDSVERYHVSAIERSDDLGTMFAVKVRKPGDTSPCDITETTADFIVGTVGDPLWLEALTPRYLVMSRSSGPQGDVAIFDLEGRSYVVDSPGADIAVDAAGVTFWEMLEPATPENCPQLAEYEAEGFGAVLAVETRLDFATGQVGPTGPTRCDPTQ